MRSPATVEPRHPVALTASLFPRMLAAVVLVHGVSRPQVGVPPVRLALLHRWNRPDRGWF